MTNFIQNEIHRSTIRKGICRVVGAGRFPHRIGISITRKPEEVFKIENVTSLLALPLQLYCKGKAIQSNFKMSSFFINKLDKLTIFAAQ